MKIDLSEVRVAIVRGVRVAYNLDNPAAFGRSFEDWLRGSVTVTRATGRSEIIDHLEVLCGRAVKGESRERLDQRSKEDQEAVAVAFEALQAMRELELMASVELKPSAG